VLPWQSPSSRILSRIRSMHAAYRWLAAHAFVIRRQRHKFIRAGKRMKDPDNLLSLIRVLYLLQNLGEQHCHRWRKCFSPWNSSRRRAQEGDD
jgi:hypothetical protein